MPPQPPPLPKLPQHPPALPKLPQGPKRLMENVKRRSAGKNDAQKEETQPPRNTAEGDTADVTETVTVTSERGDVDADGEGDKEETPKKLSLKEKLTATRSALKEKVKSSQEKLKESKPVAKILARKSIARSSMTTFVSKIDPSRKVFYINITVLDASVAIQQKVTQTLEEKTAKLPPSAIGKRVTTKVAEKVAQSLPTSKVAQTVSQKLLTVLPFKMKQLGLTVVAEKVFAHGAYFVLQLQVQHVDMATLIQEAGNKQNNKPQEPKRDDDEELEALIAKQQRQEEEAAERGDGEGPPNPNNALVTSSSTALTTTTTTTNSPKTFLTRVLDCFLSCLKWTGSQNQMQEKLLPSLIQNKLCDGMEEMLNKKMDGKKIEASVKVLSEEFQARYFFHHLTELAATTTPAAPTLKTE